MHFECQNQMAQTRVCCSLPHHTHSEVGGPCWALHIPDASTSQGERCHLACGPLTHKHDALWPWVAPVTCPCDHVLAAAARLLPHHWGVVVCVTHGLSVWSHNDETFWWPLYSSPFKHVPHFEEESHCFCELGQGRGEIVLESDVLCGETFYTGFQLAPFHAQNRLPCSHLWTGASDADASIVF